MKLRYVGTNPECLRCPHKRLLGWGGGLKKGPGGDKLHLYLRTIHPATTVDHCVAAHFTCPTTLNLVVAMANVLEVYCVTDRPAAPLVLYKHYAPWHAADQLSGPIRGNLGNF